MAQDGSIIRNESFRYTALHNLFSLYCSKWSGDAMKKLRKRKSYSTFSLNSIDSRRKWKSLVILLFFILLNSLLSGSRSGAPKKGTQGIGARQKPCFLPSSTFFFMWTHCRSAAGQRKMVEATFFFVWENWTAASPQRNEKVSAKTTFFFIELNCRRSRAKRKKKRLWNAVYFIGSQSENHLLINGWDWREWRTSLRALWKDMLLYLSNGHIFLWFGDKLRKIDGGEWGVHLWGICRSKNFFFWSRHLCTPRNFCHSQI